MQIIGRELDDDIVDDVLYRVKRKKDFSGIDNAIVVQQMKNILSSDSSLLDKIIEGKKTPLKELMKKIRAELHRIHGSFNIYSEKRSKLLREYAGSKERAKIFDILRTHSSTSERLPIYENLYSNLFDITGKPSSILDVGSGLNPLSAIFFEDLKDMNLDYVACDISDDILDDVKMFFDQEKSINGEVRRINLFDMKEKDVFKSYEMFDVCFIFKVLEIIEQSKSHKISENIVKAIPADWVVVSFPKKTVSGKNMNHPYRGWFDRMLHRLEYMNKILEYDTEIFYIIKKKKDDELKTE